MTPAPELQPATLVVVNPSGNRSRAAIEPLPFHIGRSAENHLVLRDNRASRRHARVTAEGGAYFVEDLGSRNGVTVNGQRVERAELHHLDRIEFGVADSYTLIFTLEEHEIQRLIDQFPAPGASSTSTGNLAKLRALVEVARVLQSSLSTHDVLGAVVDAAMSVTGAERGFLLLRSGDELGVEVARDRKGMALRQDDLRVPTRLISRALKQRRELLSMNFDPYVEDGVRPDVSSANLDLRSVVCVPLVRVRTANLEETSVAASLNETVGLLYLDSRQVRADLAGGNRELLQTLALEASTILENARLLEQERANRKMEEELALARSIQAGLLPRSLPVTGWFRVAGSSVPSHQVGGDYYDVRRAESGAWWTVVADVSGKGVSSALLASLLQGAFLNAPANTEQMREMLAGISRFLYERTEGEKYATAFVAWLDAAGTLRWANAGHPAPLLLRGDGSQTRLNATGLPLGLMDLGDFQVEETRLKPGDRVLAYTDGLSEAQNAAGEMFDLRGTVAANRGASAGELHAALTEAFDRFNEGGEPADDVTIVVFEYAGG